MSDLTIYDVNERASVKKLDESLLAKIVQSGNLAYLSESDRLVYYFSYCRQLGLNPLSRPFDYISEGEGDKLKISLYPNTIAASQLRDSRNVSTRIVREEILLDGEVYSVLVEARIGDRTEEATGKVGIKLDKYGKPLSGEAKAKLMKKAESQARRRATLAIVGLDAMGEGDNRASISDMPPDCWTPDLDNKLTAIAVPQQMRPSWDEFYKKFCDCHDRCETEEQLDKLIKWAFAHPAYQAYPENHGLIEAHLAIAQERVSF
jgi:hypothetical protein